MGKKNRPIHPQKVEVPAQPILSKRSWKWIGTGIVLLIIGYFVLSKADSRAQNWAGKGSPFLILGGYALIGIGLFLKPQTPAQ